MGAVSGSAGDARELTGRFLSAAGARQTMAVLLPVRMAGDPPWTRGPLPFALDGRPSDAARARTVHPTTAYVRARRTTPGADGLTYRQLWLCSAALSPPQEPVRWSTSTLPVVELRRKRRLSAPDSSTALAIWPSGRVTRVPAVT